MSEYQVDHITVSRSAVAQCPFVHDRREAQVRAYRLSANRLAELSQWDDALLKVELAAIIEFDETPIEILGWEIGEIDQMLSADDPNTADDLADVIPQMASETVTRLGDLWCLGKHRLLCASSLEPANWAGLMDGAVAAMAFTDAPYNVPISGHGSCHWHSLIMTLPYLEAVPIQEIHGNEPRYP